MTLSVSRLVERTSIDNLAISAKIKNRGKAAERPGSAKRDDTSSLLGKGKRRIDRRGGKKREKGKNARKDRKRPYLNRGKIFIGMSA